MRDNQSGRSAVSLHQQIMSDIEERILSGDWRPGHRIPFEHELTVRFNCSRMTVSKALTQLANAGLIERRRKAGSFVALPHSRSAVLEIQNIEAEVLALALPYRFEIIACRARKARRAENAMAELAPGAKILDITCLHLAGVRPFCLEQRLINLEAVPDASQESFADIAPGTWLVQRVPWSAAEHRIKAVAADAAQTKLLKISGGAACLVIERRTWSADKPITFVRLTYPGDAHDLVARFAPPQGGP